MTHKKCYFLHDLASYSIACNINTVEEYDVSFTVNSYKIMFRSHAVMTNNNK